MVRVWRFYFTSEPGGIEVPPPAVGSIYAWQQAHRAEIQAEQLTH